MRRCCLNFECFSNGRFEFGARDLAGRMAYYEILSRGERQVELFNLAGYDSI